MYILSVLSSVAACLVSVRQKSTITGPSLDGPDRYVKTTPINRLDVPK